MWKIVIITWVSGSGKTTLQEELKKQGWFKPINFSTRKPRNDLELDDYVFITKEQFIKKLINWDFLEFTTYWNNFYWIANLPENLDKNYAIILDPIWRAQIMKKFAELWIKYHMIYLDISKETLKERLINRWDCINEIEKRVIDLEWFHPTSKSIIIDWTTSTKTIVDVINHLS